MSDMQIVIFNLNNEICGASGSQIQEIVKFKVMEKRADLPQFINGLVDLRNMKVPVVDLNEKFELGTTETNKKTKIIMRRINNYFLGYIVNDVVGIENFSDSDIEDVPTLFDRNKKRYVKGVGKKDDKLISIIDLKTILDDEELKTLDEFQIKINA